MSITILTTALNAVMPIVLLTLLGYLLRVKGFFTEQFLAVGNKLVFRVCLPVMLFVNVYHIPSLSQIRLDLALYCLAVVTVAFLLGALMSVVTTKVPERRGVLTQCVFRSNFAFIGLPLADALGGDAAMAVASVLSAFTIPYFNVLGVISLSIFRKDESGKQRRLGPILADIAKNPLIAGVVAGFAVLLVRQWQVSQFGEVLFSLEEDLPFLYTALEDLKVIASPFALLVLGGQFQFSAVRSLWKEISVGTVWRTLLVPLLGIGGAVVLSAWGVLECGVNEYPALVALFGSPVALSSAIMAREMKNDEQLATQLVVWTTLVSVLTTFAMVCLMMSLGLLAV